MKFGYSISVGNHKSKVVHSRWLVATEPGAPGLWYAAHCWSVGPDQHEFADLETDGTLEGAMSAALSDAGSYLLEYKDTHLWVERHEE